MVEAHLVTASRDVLARALCDYWDPDDEASRARSGYPCDLCRQEADYLLERGIVQVPPQPDNTPEAVLRTF